MPLPRDTWWTPSSLLDQVDGSLADLRARTNATLVVRRDEQGRSVLHLVSRSSQFVAEMVAVLVEAGCDPLLRDARGNTPLHYASHRGAIEELIAAGADPNARNARGLTPLHFVVAQGYVDLCAPLIAHGADLNARSNDGDTPWDVRFAPFVEAELFSLGARSGHGETIVSVREKPKWAWFWSLVDGEGDRSARFTALRRALAPLTADDLVRFQRHWQHLVDHAPNRNGERLARRLHEGSSDDGLEDFCAWLVSKGKAFYETARKRPASLPEASVDVAYEDTLGVLFDAWAARTKQEGSTLLDATGPDLEL